eukprot:9977211-Alexandrium_andersonii.AAC.1
MPGPRPSPRRPRSQQAQRGRGSVKANIGTPAITPIWAPEVLREARRLRSANSKPRRGWGLLGL